MPHVGSSQTQNVMGCMNLYRGFVALQQDMTVARHAVANREKQEDSWWAGLVFGGW